MKFHFYFSCTHGNKLHTRVLKRIACTIYSVCVCVLLTEHAVQTERTDLFAYNTYAYIAYIAWVNDSSVAAPMSFLLV